MPEASNRGSQLYRHAEIMPKWLVIGYNEKSLPLGRRYIDVSFSTFHFLPFTFHLSLSTFHFPPSPFPFSLFTFHFSLSPFSLSPFLLSPFYFPRHLVKQCPTSRDYLWGLFLILIFTFFLSSSYVLASKIKKFFVDWHLLFSLSATLLIYRSFSMYRFDGTKVIIYSPVLYGKNNNLYGKNDKLDYR